tara:strand:+ start:549 stop:1448 length:900 start_codon:yes stop_codon:yes gene_type:complete
VIKVSDIRVRSFDVDYLDIYWELEPAFEDLYNYEFTVERSDNEFGPYVAITNPIVDRYHVRDTTVRGRYTYYTKIYYRISVRNKGTGEVAVYPERGGAKLAAKPDLAALEMARLNNLRLKEFSGRKIWIFPKKKHGQRCGLCYDTTTSRKLRSQCPNCFDTTWVGGYHAPVETYGMIVSPNEQTIHANFGNVENENTSLMLGNYPEVFEGDLIVEAENIRWRVASSISKVKKARSLVRQQLALHRIPKGDIEYKIPVNLTEQETRDLIASPERNYTNPHTLESAKLSNVLTNVFGNSNQ